MSFASRRLELAAPKAGIKRVHFIGDSIVRSAGVNLEDSLPVQLEQTLNQEFPHELFSCISFGHDGWNLWNSLFQHEALFPEGGCDLLVLTLCSNDSEYLGSYGIVYSPDKVGHWQDTLLNPLADRGFKTLKAYLDRFKIPALIVHYESYQPAYVPVGETIGELCAKHNIPYLNIVNIIHETHHIPGEQLIVSTADGHPSALHHQLASRHISIGFRQFGMVRTQPEQENVINRLKNGVQEMLDNGYDPQAVFSWAARAAKAKTLALPRVITDRSERQVARNQLGDITEAIHSSWYVWQQEVWREGTLRNIHNLMLRDIQLYINIENFITPLVESIRLAVWGAEAGQLPVLEERMHSLLPSIDLLPFDEIMAQLHEEKDKLEKIVKAQKREKSQETAFQWRHVNFLALRCEESLLQWSDTVIGMINIIEQDFETLRNVRKQDSHPSDAYLNYLADIIKKITEDLKTICKTVSSRMNFLDTGSPMVGIDVFVTVRTANTDTRPFPASAITLKLESFIPASINKYGNYQMVDSTVAEKTYHVRLPLFAHANLAIYMRWNLSGESKIDDYGFSIAKIVLRTAFFDDKIPARDIKILEYTDPNLKRIELNNLWLNCNGV